MTSYFMTSYFIMSYFLMSWCHDAWWMMHDTWCTRHTGGMHPQCDPNERTHTWGDTLTVLPIERTHIFSQGGMHPQCNPTNGHTYFHRGGRTHNVTQRTDTQIFFDVSARIYASCARIFARIFMKIWLVVKYYFANISAMKAQIFMKFKT